MANDHQNVMVKKTFLVHPKSHPQQTTSLLQLSNLDRKCPALMYLVFFYTKPPPSPHNNLSDFVSELKEGLEEILSAWYPAAGRLSLDSGGRLNLDSNSYGAIWAEAETQVHVSELGNFSQADQFLEKLVFRPEISADRFIEMPLVVVQVTEFGCGGYAVGVGTNHALFDGSGNFNFISAWASKTSGREDVPLKPLHERGRLLIDHGQNHNHSAFPTEMAQITTGVIAFDHLYQLVKQAIPLHELERKLGAYEISGGEDKDEFALETFTISEDMVEELKSKVDGSSCTSFEVVAAHLWKVLSRT